MLGPQSGMPQPPDVTEDRAFRLKSSGLQGWLYAVLGCKAQALNPEPLNPEAPKLRPHTPKALNPYMPQTLLLKGVPDDPFPCYYPPPS